MVNRIIVVQECDATKLNSITKVDKQKIKEMKSSKIAAALSVAAMIIGASLNAQVIDQKNITLEAAKKL